jgi:hypothetical protein
MTRRARAHSGVGGVAGHFSKSARNGAPPVISGNVKDKPASYFVVKVAHPPERDRKLDAAKEQRKNRRQRAA